MNKRTIISALAIFAATAGYVHQRHIPQRHELQEIISKMDERACALSDSAYESVYLIPPQVAGIAGWGEVQAEYSPLVSLTSREYDTKYWKLREQLHINDAQLIYLKKRKKELEEIILGN